MFQLPLKLPLTFTTSEGRWVDIFSPNDGSFVTSAQEATPEDIDKLLGGTRLIQKKMASLKPYEKGAILKTVASELKGRLDEFAFVIATEGGKPLKDARVEAERASLTLELCAEEALRLTGETIPMERSPFGEDHLAFTMRDPIGAVLAISAFNHPLNLLAHQVGCAIAASCSVVVKPAPSTPICAYLLRDMFLKAGLDSKAFRIVLADVPVIQKLARSPVFDYVNFIGSAQVGWELRRIIAPGTRINLEHGGIAPAIVCDDANLEQAALSLLKGSFYHAGQVCISTQRIFVHKKVIDDFLTIFTAKARELRVGPATSGETDIGPLVRPAEVTRIRNWISEAVEKGAKVELGNSVSGNLNQYLSPTIVRDVPRDAQLMREEVFGPVVCVNSFEDEEELIDYLSSSDYIFEASLFTNHLQRSLRIARSLSTMTLVINNHSAFRVDQMPFGGHKKSGLGMGGVRYAIEEMTKTKQIILKVK
jgi:acyl-CoA reductase-like NAD-dependent aldehyde dehydrogenase